MYCHYNFFFTFSKCFCFKKLKHIGSDLLPLMTPLSSWLFCLSCQFTFFIFKFAFMSEYKKHSYVSGNIVTMNEIKSILNSWLCKLSSYYSATVLGLECF